MKWSINILIICFFLYINSVNCKQNEEDYYFEDYKEEEEIQERIIDDNEQSFIEDNIEPVAQYDINKASELFEKFIKDFNKNYKNDEDRKKHYEQFIKNLKEINTLNAESDGSATYDINMFTDLSESEKFTFIGIGSFG